MPNSTPPTSFVLIFLFALLAVLVLLSQTKKLPTNSSLSISSSPFQQSSDVPLTEAQLSRLTLSPQELERRRSWVNRKGLRAWQHNLDKTAIWNQTRHRCNLSFPGCVPPCTMVRGTDFHRF